MPEITEDWDRDDGIAYPADRSAVLFNGDREVGINAAQANSYVYVGGNLLADEPRTSSRSVFISGLSIPETFERINEQWDNADLVPSFATTVGEQWDSADLVPTFNTTVSESWDSADTVPTFGTSVTENWDSADDPPSVTEQFFEDWE